MYIGLGVDITEQAAVQAFVDRVGETVRAAAEGVTADRASGMLETLRLFQEAARRAGQRDHGAGLGVMVVETDGVYTNNGAEIVPPFRFAAGGARGA